MNVAMKTPDGKAAVPGVPRPAAPAHVIESDAEAIAIAETLAADFAGEASERDRERRWPVAELDRFSQSGLWSINVPKAFGGPELSYVTLNKVIETISAADPSLGQIPQNHLGVVAAIRTVSDEAQKKLLFGEVLRARGSATPSPSSARSAPQTSRQSSRTRATTSSSPARSSIRRVRCSRISCRSWRSMMKVAPGTRSPIATRRGSR